ncbi:hypothetical protein E0H80_16205 [Acinetobacter sp. ANC 4779]|uniref:hypothetical protein n=1 Tax=Acinetobacter sp. ANC 4779 TaxID=2529848 RepID=UPI00103E2B51|nr:hypothetical protein [Acinetobacter sp. ANC 4779]TCB47339.1 hypothetical protein E0H80_16205 [Acinetobacter sp. ANC 4779]
MKKLVRNLISSFLTLLSICLFIALLIILRFKQDSPLVIVGMLGVCATLYAPLSAFYFFGNWKNETVYKDVLNAITELNLKVKEFEELHRNADSIFTSQYLINFDQEMHNIIDWQLSIIHKNAPINSIEDVWKFDMPIKEKKYEVTTNILNSYRETIISHLNKLEQEIKFKINEIEVLSENHDIYSPYLDKIDFTFIYSNLLRSLDYYLNFQFLRTPLWGLKNSFDASYGEEVYKNMEVQKYLEGYHNNPPENFISKGFTSEETYKNIIKKRILEINNISKRIQENF